MLNRPRMVQTFLHQSSLKGCEWLHACVLAKLCIKAWYYSLDIPLYCQGLRVSQNLVHPAFHNCETIFILFTSSFITFHQLTVSVLASNSTLHGVALHQAHPNGLRLETVLFPLPLPVLKAGNRCRRISQS